MKYLLPVDGSAESVRAAEHVVATAGPGAEVVLLALSPCFSRHLARHLPRATRDDYRAELSRQRLAVPLAVLGAAGITTRTRTLAGADGESIARIATEERVSEVVLGIRRQPAWLSALGGSLAQSVIDHSPVPVTVVASGRPSLLARFGLPAGAVGLTALVLAVE